MKALFTEPLGIRTRILCAGSGTPVLLLHGLGTMAERWLRTFEGLSSEYRLLAPDLLCSGFTGDVAFADCSPQQRQIQHLLAILDDFRIDTCAVVGSSYGGLIAALLHLKHPERFPTLAIVGSGSALHPPETQREVLLAAKSNALMALHEGTLDACRKRLERISFKPHSVPAELVTLQLTANALPGRAKASTQLYESLLASLDHSEEQSFPHLEKISAQTIIITGKQDPRASATLAKEASERIASCEIEIFDECGHSPMLEQPELFNDCLRQFLGANVDGSELQISN